LLNLTYSKLVLIIRRMAALFHTFPASFTIVSQRLGRNTSFAFS